jgi:hypothetical protein
MKQAHFQLFPLTHEYTYDVNGNMLVDNIKLKMFLLAVQPHFSG